MKTRWIIRATRERDGFVVWIGHRFGECWTKEKAEEQANILKCSGLYINIKVIEQQIPNDL